MARATKINRLAAWTNRRVCACAFSIRKHSWMANYSRFQRQNNVVRAKKVEKLRCKRLLLRRKPVVRIVACLIVIYNTYFSLLQDSIPSNQSLIDNGTWFNIIVKNIPKLRGVGVWAKAPIAKGQLLFKYVGTTLTLKEGKALDAKRNLGTDH